MELDIRMVVQEINTIRFHNTWAVNGDGAAHLLTRIEYTEFKGLTIEDDMDSVTIESEGHAKNLIAALEKAIELGWFKS